MVWFNIQYRILKLFRKIKQYFILTKEFILDIPSKLSKFWENTLIIWGDSDMGFSMFKEHFSYIFHKSSELFYMASNEIKKLPKPALAILGIIVIFIVFLILSLFSDDYKGMFGDLFKSILSLGKIR